MRLTLLYLALTRGLDADDFVEVDGVNIKWP